MFPVSFSFLFLALHLRLSCSRSQSALAQRVSFCAFTISAACFLLTLICSSISPCVFLDYFVRLLCFAAILPALLFDLLPLLCVLSRTVLSSQGESCRVSDLISAQSPSCRQPVVRLPPGAALRTVLPSVEVAARHSGRDRTSSRSSQVCYCDLVFLFVFFCSAYAYLASEQQFLEIKDSLF